LFSQSAMTGSACNARISARLSSLALGQGISALIAGTGIFSTLLANAGIAIPTSQSVLNYLLLAVVFGGYRAWRHGGVRAALVDKWPVAWWRYAALAVCDVEANFLIVKAYQYTTITSIMLIDCWTIPCVMALSTVFLRTRFAARHYVGVVACVVGLAVLVVSDYLQAAAAGTAGDDTPTAGKQVIGDLLTFAAATLYAISNVGQEALVKTHDRTDFLARLGGFGLVLCTMQLVVLERNELAGAAWTAGTVGALLGFALCLFGMYAATSAFLRAADSTLFNLSLLTSDVWAIIASVFLFHTPVHPLYFLALVIIVVGIAVYNSAPAPTPRETAAPAPLVPGEGDGRRSGEGGGQPECDADTARLAAASSPVVWDGRPVADVVAAGGGGGGCDDAESGVVVGEAEAGDGFR